MSEQYPLLCEDLSDEERFSPHFHRRFTNRARTRNNLKGAAAIITRWPEHWTTLMTYWWMGIGMIAISTFLIYNFLFSYAMVQSTDVYSRKTLSAIIPKTKKPFERPKVLMHIFLDDKQEINWDDYWPYIEIITYEYTDFQYEVILVINDTNVDVDTSIKSYDENNEQALNSLMRGDFKNTNSIPEQSNLRLRHTTISQHLRDSPLNRYWKTLPDQFTKLLVRAASIWEKGGIAFDPILLTPQSPHPLYIDKIHNILKKYNTTKVATKTTNQKISLGGIKRNKITPKVNNIRDVIDALSNEHENPSDKSYQDLLMEAESKNKLTILDRHDLLSPLDKKIDAETETNNKNSNEIYTKGLPKLQNNGVSNESRGHDSLPKTNLLPLFLDYLFHNKHSTISDEIMTNTMAGTQNDTEINYEDHKDKSLQIGNFQSTAKDVVDYKPVIISAKGILETTNVINSNQDMTVSEHENAFEVTIDLKGNIIATDITCHAFIGGMFSNAIHHDRSESVTDFIIKELSIFCQGLLASCVGIDVILL